MRKRVADLLECRQIPDRGTARVPTNDAVAVAGQYVGTVATGSDDAGRRLGVEK